MEGLLLLLPQQNMGSRNDANVPWVLHLSSPLPLPQYLKSTDMCQALGDGAEAAVIYVLSTFSQMQKTDL